MSEIIDIDETTLSEKIPPIAVALGNNLLRASLTGLPSPWDQRVVGHTNIGKGRKKNQDAVSLHVFNEKLQDPYIILAVADGLGSSRTSELAAYEAVKRIPIDLGHGVDLLQSFDNVHQNLSRQLMTTLEKKKEAKWPEHPNMGSTTLVLAEVFKNEARIANVGDSRAYLIRKNDIVYQSRDQSMVELLSCQGQAISRSELRRHPMRNVILNAIGSPESTYRFIENDRMVQKRSGMPTVDSLVLKKNDVLVLASDGFFTNITEEELVSFIDTMEWQDLESHLVGHMTQIFDNDKTTLGEAPNPDNFTFLIYRHEQS